MSGGRCNGDQLSNFITPFVFRPTSFKCIEIVHLDLESHGLSW